MTTAHESGGPSPVPGMPAPPPTLEQLSEQTGIPLPLLNQLDAFLSARVVAQMRAYQPTFVKEVFESLNQQATKHIQGSNEPANSSAPAVDQTRKHILPSNEESRNNHQGNEPMTDLPVRSLMLGQLIQYAPQLSQLALAIRDIVQTFKGTSPIAAPAGDLALLAKTSDIIAQTFRLSQSATQPYLDVIERAQKEERARMESYAKITNRAPWEEPPTSRKIVEPAKRTTVDDVAKSIRVNPEPSNEEPHKPAV